MAPPTTDNEYDTNRRSFLKYAAAMGTTLAVAGCIGDDEEPEDEVPPDDDDETPPDDDDDDVTPPDDEPPEEFPEPEILDKTEEVMTNTSLHGSFKVHVKEGVATGLSYFDGERHRPSTRATAVRSQTYNVDRIRYPMVREGWEPGGGGNPEGRGSDDFVRISWEEAFELVAQELERVVDEYGPESIAAHCVWVDGGNFQAPGTNMGKVLSLNGGYTRDVDHYSWGAQLNAAPYSIGWTQTNNFADILENTEYMLLLGNNSAVTSFIGTNVKNEFWKEVRDSDIKTVMVDPRYTDTAKLLDGDYYPIIPQTDDALMVAMCYVMLEEDLYDEEFIETHSVGFEPFRDYLLGEEDGTPKTPEWAETYTAIPADDIRQIARDFANHRSIISYGGSVQRAQYGEQSVRLKASVAALAGQIGRPGSGPAWQLHYSSAGGPGRDGRGPNRIPGIANPITSLYPDAAKMEMLLNPGKEYFYDGEMWEYPDIKLWYWGNGNPMSTHPDVNKQIEAFRQLETMIINEPWWVPTARFSDIILPVAWNLERNDIFAKGNMVIAGKKAIEPLAEAKSDYDIWKGIAEELGVGMQYHEGKDEMEWIEDLYEGSDVPLDFEEFWEQGYYEFDWATQEPSTTYGSFREDPEENPLNTPTGYFEFYSETLAEYDLDDCPPTPQFMLQEDNLNSPKAEEYPLHVMSPHTHYRLHSHTDSAMTFQGKWTKINGLEAVWIHPDDAAERGIEHGDTVRVWNDRGQILGGAFITERIRPGAIAPTYQAWYDPEEPGEIGTLDRGGTTNTLTSDEGTSSLCHAVDGKSVLGEIEVYEG